MDTKPSDEGSAVSPKPTLKLESWGLLADARPNTRHEFLYSSSSSLSPRDISPSRLPLSPMEALMGNPAKTSDGDPLTGRGPASSRPTLLKSIDLFRGPKPYQP